MSKSLNKYISQVVTKESAFIALLLFTILSSFFLYFYKPGTIYINFISKSNSVLQVYWATEQQGYSEKNSSRVYYPKGAEKLKLALPDLKRIISLRIDPAIKISEFIIRSIIIEQPGYKPITFETAESLKTIKPIYDIFRFKVHARGLNLKSSGKDPQLELHIRPSIKSGIQRYRDYTIGIVIIVLVSILMGPLTYHFFLVYEKKSNIYPTKSLPSHKVIKASTLIAIIGSIFLIFVIPIKTNGGSKLISLIFYLIGMGVPLFLLSYWLISLPIYKRPIEISANLKAWSWCAIPCVFVWSIYLLAFWPCSMSPDSLSQWKDALTGHFHDWHPAFHSMNYWLISKVWRSPSAVAWTQIIALSLTVAWGLRIIRQLGVSTPVILIVCLFMALTPVNGLIVITLWKDVAYSISLLVLTLFVLRIVITDGQWLSKRRSWISMGIIISLTAIYRHNGISVALGTPFILFVFYRKFWKQLVFAFLLGGVIYFGIRGPLYGILDIQRNLPKPYFKPRAKYINPEVDESSKSVSKHSFSGTSFIENAQKILFYYADLSSTLWRIKPLKGRFKRAEYANLWWEEEDGIRYINSNKLGIQEASLLPNVRDYCFEKYLHTLSLPSKYFFWRPAFYLYLLLFSLIIASVRFQKWKLILVMVPIITHLTPFFLISTSKAVFRYHYSIAIISMLLSIPLLFMKQSSETSIKQQ